VMQLVSMKCRIHRSVLPVKVFVLHLRHGLVMKTAAFLHDEFFYLRYHIILNGFCEDNNKQFVAYHIIGP